LFFRIFPISAICLLYFYISFVSNSRPYPDRVISSAKKSVPESEVAKNLNNWIQSKREKIVQGSFGSNVKKVKVCDIAESSSVFRNRHHSNYMISSTHCVTESSQKTYNTGWSTWKEFCLLSETDSLLRFAPITHCTTLNHADEADRMYAYRVDSLGCFSSWLAIDKGLNPSTIGTYTAGVRDWFRREHKDLAFFCDEGLRNMRRAMHLDWIASHDSVHEKATLPFTLDMVMKVSEVMDISVMKDHAMKMGLELQFLQLLRVSELLPTPSDHYIRGQDILFYFRSSDGNIIHVFPHEVSEYKLEDLIKVELTVRSAKNDLDGSGMKYSHIRTVNGPNLSIDLAANMYNYALVAKPLFDEPFLTYVSKNDTRRWCNYGDYNALIKKVARHCNFNDRHFSTHSLRRGGATLLAVAGHPNHYIRSMMRSKSDSFLRYIHFAVGSMLQSQKSLLDPSIFTMKDLLETSPSIWNHDKVAK